VELADGGLDWLIETGGLYFEVEGRQEEVQKEQK